MTRVAFLLLLVACQRPWLAAPGSDLPPAHPPVVLRVDEVTTTTAAAAAAPALGRDRRRVDLDALAAMIEDFTGVAWEDGTGASKWLPLRATLGVPDYLKRTSEDLTVTPLFVKYLDDAARDVCGTAVSSGTLLRAANDPPETVIRDLVLRAHGRKLGANDLAAWMQLYTDLKTIDQTTAWTGMCVAMIRHPDFYSY